MGHRRPRLVVVTGRPGAGKTTLARALADALPCALLSRDALKAGWLQTLGVAHHELGSGANQPATQIFAATTTQLLQAGVSLVIEAAFQHAVWQPWLLQWSSGAEIRLIICQVADALAHQRVLARCAADPTWERMHGSVPAAPAPYQPPQSSFPTIVIPGDAAPDLEMLRRFALMER